MKRTKILSLALVCVLLVASLADSVKVFATLDPGNLQQPGNVCKCNGTPNTCWCAS